MKNLFKGALFLAIVGTLMISCNKEEDVKLSESPTHIKSKADFTNSKSLHYITVDDSAYSVLSSISNSLGCQSINIKDQSFDITYGSGNYGSASIPIDNYALLAGGPIVITIKLGIYSRKKGCLHGVGLRCGFNSGMAEPSREFNATVEVNESNNTLDVQFLEYVDWTLLND